MPCEFESGSERIPRSLLRGKRANGEHYYSLWIEDSPQFTAESFNLRKSQITASSSTIDSPCLFYNITVLNDHMPLQRSVGKK